MNQGTSAALESVAIKSMATQLKNASNRCFVRQARLHVDEYIQLAPERLGYAPTLAILVVLVLGRTFGVPKRAESVSGRQEAARRRSPNA